MIKSDEMLHKALIQMEKLIHMWNYVTILRRAGIFWTSVETTLTNHSSFVKPIHEEKKLEHENSGRRDFLKM